MSRRLLRMSAAVLFALGATACQPGEDEVPQTALAQAEAPLEGTQSACNAQQIAWSLLPDGSAPPRNTGACEGPWEYSNYNVCYVKKENSPDCPVAGYVNKTCYNPYTCASPDFGVQSRGDRNFTVSVTPTSNTVQECDENQYGKWVCHNVTYYSADAQCRSAANAEVARVDDRYEAGVTVKSYYIDVPESSAPLPCTFTLSNYPTYNSRADYTVCGGTSYDCSYYTYQTCRTAAHGLTADPAECYNENPTSGMVEPTRLFSPPGLSLDGLRASVSSRAIVGGDTAYAPRCTTATDMLMRNPAEVRAKFDALKAQLATLDGWDAAPASAPASVDRPALRRQAVTNAKLLFELKGSQLDDAPSTTRTDAAVQLYKDFPEGGYHKVTRVDPVVDFTWGSAAPMTEIPAEDFSVRWTGTVTPRFTGTYTFYTTSDDGVRLYVNNQLVINNWTIHGITEDSGTLALEAGKPYALRMEFYEHTGAAAARLLWSSASQPKEVIPSTQLKTANGTPGLTGEYFDNSRFDNHEFTSRTDCGNPWTGPVSEATCAGARDLNSLFAMCRRMTLDHVPADSAAQVLGRCIDAITQAQATACAQGQYLTAYDDIVLPLLKEHVVTPHVKTGNAQLNGVLQRKLAFVDQWYRTARAQVYGGNRLDAALNQRTSQVLGEFWRGAYMSEHPLGMRTDGVELPAESVDLDSLQTLSDDYLKVDRAVLQAAFSNRASPATPPMLSAPLMLVTSDALHGMTERLEQLSDGHDLGCRLRGCAASHLSTEVSQLWRLVSVLPDATALNTTLSASAKVSADWRATFTQVVSGHDALKRSIEDALGLAPNSYVATAFDARTAESRPAVSDELFERVRNARQRIASYDTSGEFDPTLRNVLHTGMNSEKQAEINDVLDTSLANLTSAINTYEQGRNTLLTTYLEEMRASREQERSLNTLRQRLARMAQLETDLAGMRHNARIADARDSEFVRTFEQLASQPQVADYQVELRPAETVTVSALDSRFTGPEGVPPTIFDNVRTLAAKGWVRQAESGDVVRIDIDPAASWAPTCALRSPSTLMRLPASAQFVPVNTTGITTGPEGFTVSLVNGGYNATAVASTTSSGTYDSLAVTGDVCAGVRAQASTPGLSLTGTGATVYAEARACVSGSHSGQWSDTTSDTSTDGQERRSMASFTTGLRLPNTPFPHLPVGSLLLVELQRGGTSRADIVQIHPLQRSTNTVLINNPASDLILVANDRQCGDVSAQALTLTVRQTKRLGSGALAQVLLQAMAKAKTSVEAAGQTALEEGHVNPATLASLRSNAVLTLETDCACTLASYPPHFQSLFNAWVDHEIASLSRHADILAAEREMSLLGIEIEGLGSDLSGQEAESRLLKLMPLWALRDMEGAELAGRTQEVAQVVNRYLFPIIHLRYPEVLDSLSRNADATKEMAALTDGTDLTLTTTSGSTTTTETLSPHWTRSRLATAKIVRSLVGRVKTALATARLGSDNSTAQFPVLALSFPRPGAHEPGWQSLYPMADELRSAKVWDEMLSAQKASFTVLPEDLYGLNGGEQMLCNQSAMVIRSMSLFISIPGIASAADTLNGLPQITPVLVNQSMAFTTKAGPEQYQQLNPKWLGTFVYPVFGEPHEAKTKFAQWRQSARKGNGLSPFTTFDFGPAALRSWQYHPLDMADELVLLFEVETEPTADGTPMTWIKSCNPSAPAAAPSL